MRNGGFQFSGKWMRKVQSLAETGMGYTVVRIVLNDGRVFEQVVIDSGHLTRIRGIHDVPFKEEDIAEITATHAKWDWNESP
jgi:hypothetical protein